MQPDRHEVDTTLEVATAAYDSADFEAALDGAARARGLLPEVPESSEDRSRLVRSHLLAGMVHVALGEDDDARASFRSALALDRALTLDPARVSPKVLSTFEAAQAE